MVRRRNQQLQDHREKKNVEIIEDICSQYILQFLQCRIQQSLQDFTRQGHESQCSCGLCLCFWHFGYCCSHNSFREVPLYSSLLTNQYPLLAVIVTATTNHKASSQKLSSNINLLALIYSVNLFPGKFFEREINK